MSTTPIFNTQHNRFCWERAIGNFIPSRDLRSSTAGLGGVVPPVTWATVSSPRGLLTDKGRDEVFLCCCWDAVAVCQSVVLIGEKTNVGSSELRRIQMFRDG